MRSVLLVLVLVVASCKRAEAERKVIVDSKGFHPSHLALEKGGPGDVTFVRTTDETCAKAVVFRDLGVTKDLPLNQPVVVDVPTDRERSLTFACGMGMFESTLVVQ